MISQPLLNAAMSSPSQYFFTSTEEDKNSRFKPIKKTIIDSDSSEDWNCCRTSSLHQSTKSIPIRDHIHRTASEVQLHDNEEEAEYRDYCMYHRIVSGMMKQGQDRQQPQNIVRVVSPPQGETLSNIVRTRNSPLQSSPFVESPLDNNSIPAFGNKPAHILDSLEEQITQPCEDYYEVSGFDCEIFDLDL